MLNILKKLIAIPSVSGRDQDITKFIADFAAPYADEITYDPLGNLIVRKNRIIAGDVCSAEPSGFIHGFERSADK